VPDVSMLADIIPGYAIFCSVVQDCVPAPGSSPWVGIGGTSAATPLLAGGLALVDEELRVQGRQALGLVNPLLYEIDRSQSAASVFDDVVSGSNDVGTDIPGTGQPLGCCTAHAGYDEASGLGSINLAAFASVSLALQPPIVSLGLSLPRGQRPVHDRRVRATVSCSAPCQLGAYAEVSIGRAKPFEVNSRVFRLRAGGHETIPMGFSGKQLKLLRSGLVAGKRITAVVRAVQFNTVAYGVLPQAGASIQARTSPVTLTVRS